MYTLLKLLTVLKLAKTKFNLKLFAFKKYKGSSKVSQKGWGLCLVRSFTPPLEGKPLPQLGPDYVLTLRSKWKTSAGSESKLADIVKL